MAFVAGPYIQPAERKRENMYCFVMSGHSSSVQAAVLQMKEEKELEALIHNTSQCCSFTNSDLHFFKDILTPVCAAFCCGPVAHSYLISLIHLFYHFSVVSMCKFPPIVILCWHFTGKTYVEWSN